MKGLEKDLEFPSNTIAGIEGKPSAAFKAKIK